MSASNVSQSAPIGHQPTAATDKILLTFSEAGALLGVSERKAHDVLPGLVTPVVLGPRCVRIVRSELEAAVARLPRRIDPAEPSQLLRGKIAKIKRTGFPK